MATIKNVKRNTTRKPSVSLIGPGRLGIALALALESTGYKIVSLVGRSRQKLRKTAQLLDASCQRLVAKELEKGRVGDLIIVSVPDDQIVSVAEDLGRIKANGHPTVLHTSGALSSKVFASLAADGWHTGSIHPLASVSDPASGVEALRRAYWCIEGDAKATRLARRIVRDLGARAFSIDAKDKPVYHAAAVMSSGNVVSVFDVALDMLNSCGLSRREAQKILLPLLESTARNLSRADPKEAITGTFARGDLETVKLHLAALSKTDLEEALRLYRLLGQHSVKLASANLSADVVKEILENLSPRKKDN